MSTGKTGRVCVSVDAATFVFMMEVGPRDRRHLSDHSARIGRPPHLTWTEASLSGLKAGHRCADLLSVTDDGG
jgi:hypothetical protein